MTRPGHATYVYRWLALIAGLGLLALAGTQLAACGDGARPRVGKGLAPVAASGTQRVSTAATAPATASAPPAPPALVVRPAAQPGPAWRTVARVHGVAAVWLAQRGGVTLMRFDQARVHLDLHAGFDDGGESGWVYGDRVTPREVHHLVAGFNGGFKLTYANVGFASGRHVAVPLKAGLASIVTYTDGTTDIGAWRAGVPDPARTVFSVLQNQRLLVDRGVAAPTVSGCVFSCWGVTIGKATVVARSGLGVTATGMLVWAAGERLTPAGLAHALIAAGAVRAIELDINPYWVGAYLFVHHSGGPSPVPVLPGQHGIPGELLEPDARDFLAVVANR